MDMPLRIYGDTRLVGIIGDPVAHSLSPAMHNAAFAALGMNWAYVPLHVRGADVRAAIEGIRALGFRGANVTVPHKRSAAACVDEARVPASLIGAVNTIVVEEGRLVGHNTDVPGFERALRECADESFAGASALVLGAGGAARAVVFALMHMGFADLVLVNRSRGAADELADLVRGASPEVAVSVHGLDDLPVRVIRAARLVVNATSLGMGGVGKVPALLTDNLGKGHIAFDVVYASGLTAFLHAAAAGGARVVDGRAMLVHQAAVAFELWTGRVAPVDVMRDAIDN